MDLVGLFFLADIFLPVGAPLAAATHPDSGLDKLVGERDGLVEAGVDVGGDEVRRGQRVDQVVRGQHRRQQRVGHAEEALAALDLCGIKRFCLVEKFSTGDMDSITFLIWLAQSS